MTKPKVQITGQYTRFDKKIFKKILQQKFPHTKWMTPRTLPVLPVTISLSNTTQTVQATMMIVMQPNRC